MGAPVSHMNVRSRPSGALCYDLSWSYPMLTAKRYRGYFLRTTTHPIE